MLYGSSHDQRATLYLGLFLIIQGITHGTSGFGNMSDSLAKAFAIGQIAFFFGMTYILLTVPIALSSFFYLLGSYHYFGQLKNGLFWAIAILTLTSIPAGLLFDSAYWPLALSVLGVILPFLAVLRVGLLAIRQNRYGAKLFTIAHTVTLIAYIVWFAVLLFPTISHFLFVNQNNIFAVCYIGLALTISFLLAQDRAAANKLLHKQLIDLEVISQKTIAQEQEKQLLLATQNERLEQEVEARTAELKASQAQLIQKEKLASLGELTAGIAHEIQNPLNFVNNFSEVSSELVDELTQEAQAGHTEDVLAIVGDLRQNLHKIHHHGGRASAIVKGMIEHSRIDSGEKRSTDLNALADEYLKISYHGLRAKGKAFECHLATDFDSSIGQVEVSPQEIGRVLLNLYNNAFYAVRERQKHADSSYQPRVTVTTARTKEASQISISDNGTGMAESVQAKIFQPFFTTKPTGEGTGLGLSLSYDIITKGHGGSLTVESQVGAGSVLTIHLPQTDHSIGPT